MTGLCGMSEDIHRQLFFCLYVFKLNFSVFRLRIMRSSCTTLVRNTMKLHDFKPQEHIIVEFNGKAKTDTVHDKDCMFIINNIITTYQ